MTCCFSVLGKPCKRMPTHPCLPVKHNTSFSFFLLRTTVDCCGYTLSISLSTTTVWYSIYPLSFFRRRESEMPSWIILQICVNLRPPHAPVVAICPVSFTIICFYAFPSPQSETTSVYRRRDRHLLHAVYLDRLTLHHRSTWFLKCNLSTTMYIFPSLLDTAATSFCTGFMQHFFKWRASS